MRKITVKQFFEYLDETNQAERQGWRVYHDSLPSYSYKNKLIELIIIDAGKHFDIQGMSLIHQELGPESFFSSYIIKKSEKAISLRDEFNDLDDELFRAVEKYHLAKNLQAELPIKTTKTKGRKI